MATRRQQPFASASAEDGDSTLQDGTMPVSSSAGTSDISPEVPTSTIVKLGFFTVAMFAGPLSAYFLSVRTIFAGNATYAGILAAVVANLVVVAYIIAAVWEDQGDQRDERDRRKAGSEKVKKAE